MAAVRRKTPNKVHFGLAFLSVFLYNINRNKEKEKAARGEKGKREMRLAIGKTTIIRYPRRSTHTYVQSDTLAFDGEQGKAYKLIVNRTRDLVENSSGKVIKTDTHNFPFYIPRSASEVADEIVEVEDWVLRDKSLLKSFQAD